MRQRYSPRTTGVFEDSGTAEVGERVKSGDPAARLTRVRVAAQTPLVRVVTYNIHTCVGVDRRYDPRRISMVLQEIDADIACLQEVDTCRPGERNAGITGDLRSVEQCQLVDNSRL